MKTFLSTLLLLTHVSLFCQRFAAFAGPNWNIFHDYGKSSHDQSTYATGTGYTVGLHTGTIRIHSLPLLFSLQFDHYNGEVEASGGGLGGGYTSTATIEKSVISLGIYVLNVRVKNRLDLNFGVDVGARVHDGYTGTYYSWMGGSPPVSLTTSLEERYDHFNAAMYFGLRSRIAYDVPLGKSIILSPQVNYYFGLTPEFSEFPKETRSMRLYVCLGIKRKLA